MDPSLPSGAPKPARIQFIDALRGYAILMMLQGHFVHTMLDPAYADESHWLYGLWSFMRGMTAPIFFTLTGIIFVYLLLRKQLPFSQNPRVGKGWRRGLQLIGIGYLLQINVFGLLAFQWRDYWWKVDVLPCIGLALLSVIGLYALHQKVKLSLPGLLLSVALLAFFLDPVFKAIDWSFLPKFLANYFTRAHGSTFTPIPWIGYTLIGGVIGWHIGQDAALYRTAWWPLFFLLSGILLHAFSSACLIELYEATGWTGFRDAAFNNYLLVRLGHVFIVLSLFMWIEQLFGGFPRLLLKAGGETLTLYIVHYVVLYGTWLGVGVVSLGWHSWSPWATGIGALLFLGGFLLLTHYLDDLRGYWHRSARPRLTRQSRCSRVYFLRQGPRWIRRASHWVLAHRPLLLLPKKEVEQAAGPATGLK